MAASIILITGPSRSGKSEWAEALARQSNKSVTYVATALTDEEDIEWQARISRHQQRRPTTWQTVSAPTDLITLVQAIRADECVLVDSLGTWLANILEQTEAEWESQIQALLLAFDEAEGDILLVAEETGWGVVPAYPMGRRFRDRLGDLTRQIGAIAQVTYLVVAGYALNLSQLGTALPSTVIDSSTIDPDKHPR